MVFSLKTIRYAKANAKIEQGGKTDPPKKGGLCRKFGFYEVFDARGSKYTQSLGKTSSPYRLEGVPAC